LRYFFCLSVYLSVTQLSLTQNWNVVESTVHILWRDYPLHEGIAFATEDGLRVSYTEMPPSFPPEFLVCHIV